jgi:hypothetical protein
MPKMKHKMPRKNTVKKRSKQWQLACRDSAAKGFGKPLLPVTTIFLPFHEKT